MMDVNTKKSNAGEWVGSLEDKISFCFS